jgi:hypothetical protein
MRVMTACIGATPATRVGDRLFVLYPGIPDHFPQSRHFALHDCAELLRRAADGFDAIAEQPLP